MFIYYHALIYKDQFNSIYYLKNGTQCKECTMQGEACTVGVDSCAAKCL